MGPKKQPRRTAERILEATLALYNRFGEPNVSTTLIATELGISPGNLYYHYPAKDELLNALFDRYAQALDELLEAAGAARHIEDAWLLLQMLFELIWAYRFLYRDLNDLLSRNRRLETRVQRALARKIAAVRSLLQALAREGALHIEDDQLAPVSTSMVVVLSYWLSFEYVRDPRHALEPAHAGEALARGAWHTLNLLVPWLEPGSRAHLQALAQAYAASPSHTS
ncbi:MAG: TetR/AcrR family transcriptional regulator [Rubrivivax sp.]